MHARRSNGELGLVKFIHRHHGAGLRFVSLDRRMRRVALPLWRDGLVEIFYRQTPGDRSLRGPHFSLSYSGRRLAEALLASGADGARSVDAARPLRERKPHTGDDHDQRL